MRTDSQAKLLEVAAVFLRLGATSFGGPAAHIALMEQELVNRRKWVDRQRFLDLLGAANLVPGPNSTELAIHLGYERAGWPGLLVAGACFILPAMLIVLAVAWAYVRYGALPQVGWLLYGVKPVILAVVGQALFNLVRTAVRGWPTALAAALALAGVLLGLNEILMLALSGLLVVLLSGGIKWRLPGGAGAVVPLPMLFLFFLKVGSVLYGSGYVLLAFLRADLVERWGWLTSQQLLDAIAVGQFTPGPVFTTATFIGYLVGGGSGAVLATVGIFLPAFVFVGLLTRVVSAMRKSARLGRFLDGVNAASLGLMAAVTLQLAPAALVDWVTVALAVVSLGILVRFKLNSAWLVLGGAVVGGLLGR